MRPTECRGLSVCRSVTVLSLQRRLNRSRCRSGWKLRWLKEPCIKWASTSPWKGAISRGLIVKYRDTAADGTGSLGHWSPGHRFWPSMVSVSDPVFDSVLSFNMRVFRGVGVLAPSRQTNTRIISVPSTLKAQILTIYWCCKLCH